MIDKDYFKDKYFQFKDQLGRIPKIAEYLDFAKIHRRNLEGVFGNNSFSKLQIECGDKVSRLDLKRTPTDKILTQWGELARKHGRIPAQADWYQAGLKPSPNGLAKEPHNLRWSEIPTNFLKFAQGKSEWRDIVALIQGDLSSEITGTFKASPDFQKLVDTIRQWIPNRARNSEEGYKIELRNYLEQKNYSIDEESGETKSDLVVGRKYPIELKKDPTLSEYDRLMGQLIRHSLSYGCAVAVIIDIASKDRHEQFSKNVDWAFEKLGINVALVGKGR